MNYAERETRVGRTVTWSGVEWRGEGLVVRAEEAEVSAPWRLIRRGRADARVRGWSVEVVEAAGGERAEGGAFGWPELWDVLAEAGTLMEKRVGDVVLTDGVVRVAGEEIAVSELAIKGGAAAGEVSWRGEAVRFEASLATGRVMVAHAESGAVIEARLGAEDVDGRVRWAENEGVVSASGFAAGEWVPAEFALTGADWRVPVARLGLGAEEFYEDMRGNFEVRRAGEGVSVAVNAGAAAREGDLPPLKLVVGGEASLRRVRVERLELDAPSASARLSAPVEWSAEGGWDAPEAAEFLVAADLAALSAGKVAGRVAGVARWSGGGVRWAASLADGAWGEDVRELAGTFEGESDLAGTVVETAEFLVGDEAKVIFSARIAHAGGGRVEAAELKGEVEGAWLATWLPEGLRVGRVEVEATAEGALTDLQVAGTAKVTGLAYSEWRADAVEATVAGRMSEGWTGEVTVARGVARLELAGEYSAEVARIARVRWVRSDGAELVSSEEGEASRERVKLALGGKGETRVAVDWARAGDVVAEVKAWESEWLEDWRQGAAWPAVTVRKLALEGRLDADRFVVGEGALQVVWRRAGEPELWTWFAGAMDARGLNVTQLEAGQDAETLVSGAGRAPWRVRVANELKFEPAEAGEWSLRLDSRPEATVWEAVAKAAGVTLERPALALALEGAALKPSGRVEFEAGRIGLSGEGLPEGGLDLRALRLEATVNAGEILVPVLRAEVDGHRVEAEGRVAMEEDDWAELRARPVAWLLDNAEARLRVPEAEVSALARYLPRLLAPTGTVEAELSLSPGSRVDGRVVLRKGGTRPLGDFGVLHDIDLDLVLAGMEMRVERASARAGGREVSITGGARRVPGKLPVLDLALRAERFPLVRKPGLILRGDMNLTVKTNETTERTRVGGAVVLRDSLVLADIRPLLAAGGGGPASAARARPPYFSVDTPPLGDWELGVTVRWDRFVRVRTPVFEGRGSAAFALEGTLREPRVSGEFTVDPGRILFPFASFAVQEGAVRISRSDPYTARLDFRASGRRLGYDLRLEIDGTAEAPQLRLFSTPALDAETLLLMITAGVAPTEGQTAGAGQRLAAVGAYVGRDLLRTFGVAGADEERLTIRAGDQVSRAGRETYGFDFRLTDKWSVVGDYDEFDAYNMGVRRRFWAKEPKAAAEEAGEAEAGGGDEKGGTR